MNHWGVQVQLRYRFRWRVLEKGDMAGNAIVPVALLVSFLSSFGQAQFR